MRAMTDKLSTEFDGSDQILIIIMIVDDVAVPR